MEWSQHPVRILSKIQWSTFFFVNGKHFVSGVTNYFLYVQPIPNRRAKDNLVARVMEIVRHIQSRLYLQTKFLSLLDGHLIDCFNIGRQKIRQIVIGQRVSSIKFSYRKNSPSTRKSKSTVFRNPVSFRRVLTRVFSSSVEILAAMEYGVSGIAYLSMGECIN